MGVDRTDVFMVRLSMINFIKFIKIIKYIKLSIRVLFTLFSLPENLKRGGGDKVKKLHRFLKGIFLFLVKVAEYKAKSPYNYCLRPIIGDMRARGEVGAQVVGMTILIGLIGGIITIIIIAVTVPVLWPILETSSANVTSMNTSTQGGAIFKSLWVLVPLILGIALVIGLIVYVLRKFGLFGG